MKRFAVSGNTQLNGDYYQIYSIIIKTSTLLKKVVSLLRNDVGLAIKYTSHLIYDSEDDTAINFNANGIIFPF